MADRKLKIDIRRNTILKKIRQTKRVTVVQLSQELGATEVTIRNDLSALEQEGHLMRIQGGAVLLSGPHTPAPITTDIPALAHKQAKQKAQVLSQFVIGIDLYFSISLIIKQLDTGGWEAHTGNYQFIRQLVSGFR